MEPGFLSFVESLQITEFIETYWVNFNRVSQNIIVMEPGFLAFVERLQITEFKIPIGSISTELAKILL